MPITEKKPDSWRKIPLCYPAMLAPPRCESGRLIIEIGPGRGDFLFHLARTNPEATVAGIELKSKRYFKLISRTEKQALSNICLIQADGFLALQKHFGAGSADEIHINFPDPWPKRRHEKKRLLNKDFLSACADALKINGELSIITDAACYAKDISTAANELPALQKANSPQDLYPTFFAQKWLAEGREIYCQRWVKGKLGISSTSPQKASDAFY